MISIVVPCFNEEETIHVFYKELMKAFAQIHSDMEIIFIDDGSVDASLEQIKQLKKEDKRVRYLSFSRNFGKEAAILAGLEHAKGEWVVTMDVNLQDPPSLIPKMWKILTEENSKYDSVATRRSTRKGEPAIRSFFAQLFYKLLNKLSSTEVVDGARDFRMMSRKMVDAIIEDKEYNRFSKGLYAWVGFHTKWLEYENIERSSGKTKWSFWKLFKYSVEGILAYSTLPLSISSVMGILLCGVSVIALIFIVGRALLYGDPVAGWPSIVSIMIFLGGLILLSLGIIGLYLSKIYLETKKRQIYIIREEA